MYVWVCMYTFMHTDVCRLRSVASTLKFVYFASAVDVRLGVWCCCCCEITIDASVKRQPKL